MSIPEAFGKTLRRYRKAKGWSQEKLALESGHQRVFISWLENGKKQATVSTVFTLAKALDIDPSELIRGVETELKTKRRPAAADRS
jgi:transcriptional regulator with XRE-family HTH domain